MDRIDRIPIWLPSVICATGVLINVVALVVLGLNVGNVVSGVLCAVLLTFCLAMARRTRRYRRER